MTGMRSLAPVPEISFSSSAYPCASDLLGDPVQCLGDPEVAETGGDHAERVGAPLDETAGDGAGLEPDLGDRRLDRGTGRRRDIGTLVDDPRDSLHGDAAHPGDLLDRHSMLIASGLRLARHDRPRGLGGDGLVSLAIRW